MKTRTGFVTNSSSTSYLLGFKSHKRKKIKEEMSKLGFNDQETRLIYRSICHSEKYSSLEEFLRNYKLLYEDPMVAVERAKDKQVFYWFMLYDSGHSFNPEDFVSHDAYLEASKVWDNFMKRLAECPNCVYTFEI